MYFRARAWARTRAGDFITINKFFEDVLVKIDIINKQNIVRLSSPQVKKIIKAVLSLEKCVCDEVSVHFVSKKKIASLHLEFFNDPSPTDCITFPIDDENSNHVDYRILGEIFVCPETAL